MIPRRSCRRRPPAVPGPKWCPKGVGRVRPRPDFAPITPRLLRWLRPPPSIIFQSSQLWRDATLGRSNDVFRPIYHRTVSLFDPVVHLALGDGRILRVVLKQSQTDQYGRGARNFIWRTGDLWMPRALT